MKKFFVFGLSLVSVFVVVAQQDPAAKEILDGMSRKTSSGETISADFVYFMENEEMDIYEKNEGSIKMKGEKYVVTLPEIGWQVYSDGKSVWNYMEDGNQVTISGIDDSGSELMNPSTVFTIYEKGFRSELEGEEMIDGEVCYQIALFPDSEEYEVEKIVLHISKSGKMIKSARLFGTDGNLYGIDIKKVNTGEAVPDDFFVFQTAKYDDLEVIDFR